MDALNLTLFIDNLTDETYFQGGFTVAQTLGAATLTPGAPRTYGLEMTYNFF
jgi:iron complex outermembrane receptor protein